MAFAERVRRARRRFFCEARFSAASLSRASSSAAARAFASALDAVPSEPVELVRTGTAPKLPGAFRGPEARGPPRRRAARGSARRQDVRVHLGGKVDQRRRADAELDAETRHSGMDTQGRQRRRGDVDNRAADTLGI